MALRFCESWDHYSTQAQFLTKWSAVTGTYATGTGRYGIAFLGNTGNTKVITKILDSQQTWTIGFALKVVSNNTLIQICEFLDGASAQMEIYITADNKLRVARATNILATGASILSVGVWYYVEFKIRIDNAPNGTYELRINGATEVSGTDDTQATANASADRFRFRPSTGNHALAIDDIYVLDGTGSAPNNTFLGDCRIECIFPNGNGNSSQFDGSDGNSTDNYLLVDETSPDDDTTYVESADVGDKDTYAYENLATTSGAVYGLQMLPWSKKSAAGSRQIVSVARLSATETDSLAKGLSDTYQYQPDIRETKPGGGAWTISDVNSAEFGVKVSG